MSNVDVLCILVSFLSFLFGLKSVADRCKFNQIDDAIAFIRARIDCYMSSDDVPVKHYTEDKDERY